MTGTPEEPIIKEEPEAQEEVAEEAKAAPPPEPSEGVSAAAQAAPGETIQPEGVMAADSEELGGPVPEEEFPWDKVIKWGLVIAAVTLVLYLIFRRKD